MDIEKINRALSGSGIGCTYFPQTDSTNTRAKALARTGAAALPHLLVAGCQSAGRGRRGRAFFSPEGGLYMTLVLPPIPVGSLHLVTPAAAVAARRAIEALCGLSCGIKWVNDLELSGKKVCGILTERIEEAVLVGVGLNIWQTEPFPPEVAHRAAALCTSPQPGLREALAARLAVGLLALTSALPEDTGFLEEYRRHSTVLGQPVTVHTPTGSYVAQALSIDDRARLIVRDGDGQTVTLDSGEVTLRPATL